MKRLLSIAKSQKQEFKKVRFYAQFRRSDNKADESASSGASEDVHFIDYHKEQLKKEASKRSKSGQFTEAELESMKIHDLREMLVSKGIDVSTIVDKEDMVAVAMDKV